MSQPSSHINLFSSTRASKPKTTPSKQIPLISCQQLGESTLRGSSYDQQET